MLRVEFRDDPMTLEFYSSDEALRVAGANRKFRGWPHRRNENRVEPIAFPNFTPSFTLVPGEKIFTIGSCFARNIEEVLEDLGFNVVIRKLFSEPLFASPHGQFPNLNKYDPYSILNEFRWALEPDLTPYPDAHGFLEIGEDRWHDANMHAVVSVPLDIARRKRQLALENARLVKDCRVVVLTAGLVESWWDLDGNYAINEIPPISYLKKHPGRFQLRILDYDEVLHAFVEIHELLRRHLRPDFKILFTVSPVPIGSTFRNMDVIAANAYSKSVLRAAVEAFCTRYDNVDYFPSYESVIMSERALAWEDDQMHPTKAIVAANMCRLVERYLDSPDETVLSKLRETMERLEDFETGLSLESANRDLAACQTRIRKLEALLESQEALLEAKDAQLTHAQKTSAHYLRQILERDGVLVPPGASTIRD